MTGLNYSIVQLLSFSLLSIVLFVISLFFGLFLFNVKLESNSKTYFINSFLGLFTIICIYSLIFVGIKTINILPLLVLVYLCYKNSARFKINLPSLKTMSPAIYIFPIVFIIYGCYSLPESIENDVRYYSKISYGLAVFKNENLYHFYNQYDQKFHGIMPYHYTELWLASLFNQIFSIKAIISLKYIAYPFLISFISYGVLGLIDNKKFLFFLLFIGLSLLPLNIVSVFGSGFAVYTDFWLRPNFIMYYFCLIPIFYLIIEKKWELLYLVSIITASTSVVLIPCLFGGLFFLSILLLKKKVIEKKEFYKLNFMLLFAGIIMMMVYIIFSPKANLLTNSSFVELIKDSISIWKSVIYTIVTVILECGFIVILGFLLNKYLIKDERSRFLYPFVLVQVCIGVILFQILNQLDNSYQFPYFAFAASGLVLIISVLLWFNNLKLSILKVYGGTALIVICFFIGGSKFVFNSLTTSLENRNILNNKVSENWKQAVEEYLEKHEHAKGGFVLSEKDLKRFGPKSRNCLTLQMGSFISYLTDQCNLPSLTCKDTLLFDKTNKTKNQFQKAEAWMILFPNYAQECDVNRYLKNGKFDFLICSKEKVGLDTNFLIISDPNSNYLFVTRR